MTRLSSLLLALNALHSSLALVALPTAVIDSGVIIGTTTTLPSSTQVINQFLGIPFGAPPVRFQPPQPVIPWSSPHNGTIYGPACVQQIGKSGKVLLELTDNETPLNGESEDCLNLNVFTPASASAGSKAVLVWIYGGSFENGASSLHLYDGSSFAANHDIVVVTINYRTNVFGFPASPELPEHQRNLGLLDQRLALDWVQRNIAGLGGNPAKVTIAGESAGAFSVDTLLVSPPRPLPFRAAILESGQYSIRKPDNPEIALQSWKNLTMLANCSMDGALECLRALPASDIKRLIEKSNLLFRPVPDGNITYSTAPRLARLQSTTKSSAIARVPVLIGYNAAEAKPFIVGQNDTKKALKSLGFSGINDTVIDSILQQYPLGSPGAHTENDQLSLIITDVLMHCPMTFWANDSSSVGIDTWRYLFNASFPDTEIFNSSGPYHAAEIWEVFGTFHDSNATNFQRQVSQVMQKAWADFAKDPSCGPGWEQIPNIGVFGDGVQAGTTTDGKQPFRTLDSQLLDQKCALYKPLYDKITVGGAGVGAGGSSSSPLNILA